MAAPHSAVGRGDRGLPGDGGKFVWFDEIPPVEATPRGTVVYALVDPRDNTIRYIGVTRWGSMAARLDRHLAEPTNSNTSLWFERLRRLGMRPIIRPVAGVKNGEWQQAEMYWIAWCRVRAQLYNVDGGGLYRDEHGQVRPEMEAIAKRMEKLARRELATERAGRPICPPDKLRARVRNRIKAKEAAAERRRRFGHEPTPKTTDLSARLAAISARQMAARSPSAKPPKKRGGGRQKAQPEIRESKFWRALWRGQNRQRT